MQEIRDAILSGDRTRETYAGLSIPESYRAVTVHKDEVGMFEGLATKEKDPRKSLHLDDVPVPELAPGEALVAVMASAINYNTVWTSIFEPVSTFGFLERYGRTSEFAKRHDLPYHVVGSDLAGVVLRTGPGVTKWKPGQEVVAHCLSVELEDADGHNDTMLDPQQRIWGFETNFGGLAELAIVKSNQLMPKPAHLSWEEAASPGLVNSTAYRQLISKNGAAMKLGDRVLIWGASGGLGSYATQMALAGGATPICVVSSPEKAQICRDMGAELIIDRSAEGYRFWNDDNTAQDPREWQRLGKKIRELTGGHDVDIVFEHPGRETFGASVYVARKGGTIVTCASTSGYMHEYDNRYLWMNLKRIISSPLRQLPRGVGGQRADQPRPDPPDPVQDLRHGRGRPGGPRRAPQRPPGQGRRAHPVARGRARRHRRREARGPARRRSTGSATPDLRRCRRRRDCSCHRLGACQCWTGGESSGAPSATRCAPATTRTRARESDRPHARRPARGPPAWAHVGRRRGAAASEGAGPARRRPRRRPAGRRRPTGTPTQDDDRRDHERTRQRPGPRPGSGRRYGRAGRPLNRQSPFYMGFVGAHRRAHRPAAVADPGRLTTVLTLVVIAFFLALTLNPLVEFLTRHGLRRGGAVAVVFAGVVAVFTLLGLVVVPPVVTQGSDLAQKAPDYLDQVLRQQLRQGPRPALRRRRQDPGRVQQADHRRQLHQPGLRRGARRRRRGHRRHLPGLHRARPDALPPRVLPAGQAGGLRDRPRLASPPRDLAVRGDHAADRLLRDRPGRRRDDQRPLLVDHDDDRRHPVCRGAGRGRRLPRA